MHPDRASGALLRGSVPSRPPFLALSHHFRRVMPSFFRPIGELQLPQFLRATVSRTVFTSFHCITHVPRLRTTSRPLSPMTDESSSAQRASSLSAVDTFLNSWMRVLIISAPGNVAATVCHPALRDPFPRWLSPSWDPNALLWTPLGPDQLDLRISAITDYVSLHRARVC